MCGSVLLLETGARPSRPLQRETAQGGFFIIIRPIVLCLKKLYKCTYALGK
jgi:hypothetical protein